MKTKNTVMLIAGLLVAVILYNYESAETQYTRGIRARAQHNFDEAGKWFRKSAERGYAPAQYEIGWGYVHGDKVDEGIKWLRKAAEQGNADAQNTLGIWYHMGYGIKRDLDEAIKWYSKAAEQRHSYAKDELSALSKYIQYSKAAKEGDVKAMDALGDGFSTGWDREGSNYPEMLKWFRKAAEQGYAPSQYHLGYCYVDGKGVEKDPIEAVKWFSKAAEQGGEGAQMALAEFYRTGDSKPDFSKAIDITKEKIEKSLSPIDRKYVMSLSPEKRAQWFERKREILCEKAGVEFKPEVMPK